PTTLRISHTTGIPQRSHIVSPQRHYVAKVSNGRIHESYARGGRVRGYAGGGDVQAYPGGGYIQGPGSGTSDSILTLLGSGNVVRSSNTEFIVNAEQTARHRRLLELINSGQLPKFAAGGLVTKSQMKGLSSPSDMGSLTSTLGDVRSRIKEQMSGAKEARLLRILDSYGKKLIAHEKSLTSVNKALEAAKSKLNDLKQASASLASSVKSGVLSAANITKGSSGDAPVTVASIMGGLTASRDKATAFASALTGLKSKGLDKSLIQQIGEAGIDGGGLETAGALLGASSSEVSSLNDLQRQINTAATGAGKTTADAVYASAIKSQTAATTKLQKSQDKLEKTMASLAKSLNRALGGKAAGGIVGGAATGGIRSGLTWVGEHEPELLQLPAGSRVWSGPDSRRKALESAPWASMLNHPRRSGYAPAAAAAAAASAGGSDQPLVIQIRLGEKEFGELWVETGRRKVKAIGSIEATLKPPRGR
ncbi:phage tail protein, partial [Streptomyces sp. NPDC005811]